MDPDLMEQICIHENGDLYDCDRGYRACEQPGWEMDWDAMAACHDRCARETTGFDNVLCNDECEWEFCYEK
jgi:hypothetical protein